MGESTATMEAEPIAQAPPPPPPQPQKPTRSKSPSFYDNVRSIPELDWGKRAWIYVYCVEPVCNPKAFGENKYLFKSGVAILDEDEIMKDYGSGKYRLNLVYRKPAGDKSDEIDNYEFEIYNPKFPPKIPRTAWMNDPRNERWAALLPKEEPKPDPNAAVAPANLFLESMKLGNEMRRSIKEEMAPPPAPPAADPLDQAAKLASLVKSLSPPPAPPTDDSLLKSIVTLQIEQMKADREEARELRNALFQQQNSGQKSDAKSQIKELIDGLKELAPVVKEIFPGAKDAVEAVRGGGRTNGWDIVGQLAPPLFDALGKIGLALATRMPAPPPGP